jgi:hypothetical protein
MKAHTGILLVVVLGLVAGFIFLKKPAPATGTTSTAGMSGLATDASGNPIVYRDVADEFVNINKTIGSYNGTPTVSHNPSQPGPSAPPGTPATPSSPNEHPIEPTDPNPYAGLLGPDIAVNFTNRTYKNAQGQDVPLPIPANDQLIQGDQNRVWYVDSNIQHLLTDGIGPPVTNSGYPVGSPQNTPGNTSQSTSGSTINQTNQKSSSNQQSGGQA